MKKSLITIISIVVLLLIGGLFMSFKPSEEPKTEEAPKIFKRKVKAKVAELKDHSISVYSKGRLSSNRQINLTAEVQGKMLSGKIPVKVGANFNKGDLLFQVFDKETSNNLKASKSKFLSSLAKVMPNIKIDFSSDYNIWEKFLNNISLDKPLPKLPEVNNSKLRIYLSTQGILSSYYNIQASEIRYSYYKVFAPFGGAYKTVSQQEGSIVSPGKNIATIIQTDLFELSVPVSPKDVQYIKKNANVKVWTENHDYAYEGTVTRIADFVDPKVQAVNVYIKVRQQKEHPLYEGMYLTAEIPGVEIYNVVEIPRRAIFNSKQVYLVRDGALNKINVNVEKFTDERAYISGIPEGDYIVIEPLVNASEKMPVTISE
ncbi:MAG: efflux RND transporter periplasmic adaptor subunit [Hyphomicrobiales bacterium]